MAKLKCNKVYTYLDPEKKKKFFITAPSRKKALKFARLQISPGREIHKDEVLRIRYTTPTVILEIQTNEGSGPEAFRIPVKRETMADADGHIN